MHGSGSSGTNVLGTGAGCLLCWATTGPDISKIATEIRIALMLRLLQPYYGVAPSVRPLFKQSHQRPGLAWARRRDVSTNSGAQRSVFLTVGIFSRGLVTSTVRPRFQCSLFASKNRQAPSLQHLPQSFELPTKQTLTASTSCAILFLSLMAAEKGAPPFVSCLCISATHHP